METVKAPVEFWALVELFGHAKIAGYLTEQSIGGTSMVRIDVPETKKQPPFTRLFGSAAIYSINPVDEATARYYAASLDQKPIQIWDIKEMLKKDTEQQALPNGNNREPLEDDDDYDPFFMGDEDEDDDIEEAAFLKANPDL